MKNYQIYIKLFFLIPIILLLFTVRIFKNFRINKIISHTIGEMTTPIEIYICERKEGFKKFSVIWFMEKTIANEFIKKKWSQKLFILPRHILEPIYILFRSHKIFDIFLVDYSKEPKEVKRTLYENTVKRIDDKNVLLKHKPSIDFNFEEKKLGNDVKVFFNSKVSVNGGPYFQFTNDTIDIASLDWDPIKHSNWLFSSPKDYHRK